MKNIIITGASRGIGYEMAKLFADEGHQVLALSRNETPIKALQQQNIHTFSFDICDVKSLQQMTDYISNTWKKVDVLINNAGSGDGGFAEDFSLEEFRAQFDTNFFGLVSLNLH